MSHSNPLLSALTQTLRKPSLTTRSTHIVLRQIHTPPRPFPRYPSSRITRTLPSRRSASTTTTPRHPDDLIPAPREGGAPLMTRQPNRALPSIAPSYTWAKTLPLFIALIVVSSAAIFNYQKSSSSTVNSILYALRTNSVAREVLGDEVYFASKVPWVRGELNQLHGRIELGFWVKGTREKGWVRFLSVRRERGGFFETLEWSLKTEDGRVIQLLDTEEVGGRDPFAKRQLEDDD